MKHIKLFEEFANEAATTSYSKMMKGVKAGDSGPWSLVGIENKKVTAQTIDIKIKEMLPAEFEAMRREHPRAKIHIEDNGGMVVWNESLDEIQKPEIKESVSTEAYYIHVVTRAGQDSVQDFINDFNLDAKKFSEYVRLNQDEKYDIRDYISGAKGTVGGVPRLRQRFINKFKIDGRRKTTT